MAVSGGCARSVLSDGGGLVHAEAYEHGVGVRCDDDGAVAATTHGCAAALRPGFPIRQRDLPAAPRGQRYPMQHEPLWKRLGQLSNGKLLLESEDRASAPERLPHARRGSLRHLQLHRVLLQSTSSTLDVRLRESGCL